MVTESFSLKKRKEKNLLLIIVFNYFSGDYLLNNKNLLRKIDREQNSVWVNDVFLTPKSDSFQSRKPKVSCLTRKQKGMRKKEKSCLSGHLSSQVMVTHDGVLLSQRGWTPDRPWETVNEFLILLCLHVKLLLYLLNFLYLYPRVYPCSSFWFSPPLLWGGNKLLSGLSSLLGLNYNTVV